MIYTPCVMEHANPPQVALFSRYVTHGLVTAYPWIMGHNKIDSLLYLMRSTSCKWMIMDSGVFTLYRDAQAEGKKLDADFLRNYTDRYIKLIKASKWPWPVIEVDSQNVIPEGNVLVHELRKKFDDAGLKDRVIKVWHSVDGIDEFRKLLEGSPRVAMSGTASPAGVPWAAQIQKIIRHHWSLASKRHIHLLGFVNNFSATLPDNFTADSSNWAAIGIHGHTDAGPHRIEYRRGRLLCPPHLLERIKLNMDHMIHVYKKHPSYSVGRRVRWNYLMYMAAGLYLNVDHFNSVRKRNPGSDLSIIDPLDYRKKK